MRFLFFICNHLFRLGNSLFHSAAFRQNVQPPVPDISPGFRVKPVGKFPADFKRSVQILQRRVAVFCQLPDDFRNIPQAQYKMLRFTHALVRMIVHVRFHIVDEST